MAHDVVVIGGGNAALCAALAAREAGAAVLVLEKAPESERGGNSFFTAGGFRDLVGGLFYHNWHRSDGGRGLRQDRGRLRRRRPPVYCWRRMSRKVSTMRGSQ